MLPTMAARMTALMMARPMPYQGAIWCSSSSIMVV
jgi:hypothetical protein